MLVPVTHSHCRARATHAQQYTLLEALQIRLLLSHDNDGISMNVHMLSKPYMDLTCKLFTFTFTFTCFPVQIMVMSVSKLALSSINLKPHNHDYMLQQD